MLHKDLIGADLHVTKLHAPTHLVGGTDPLGLAESEITGLVTDLSGKAPTVHSHVKADITDFPTLGTAAALNVDADIATLALPANTTITAAGAAILDDADAAAQLATLGTAAYSEGTWTPVLNGATIVGAAPVLTGTYKKIGKIAFVTVTINGGSGGNTSVAFPVNQASINGFSPCPAPVGVAVDILSDDAWKSLGTCQVLSGALYLPAMTANTFKIYLTATYNTA